MYIVILWHRQVISNNGETTMKIGTYVRVTMVQNGVEITLRKGFLEVFGQGKCVVGKKEFPLQHVCLEKVEEDANEYACANISNPLPAKKLSKKHGKLHFGNGIWDSSRFCRDGRQF